MTTTMTPEQLDPIRLTPIGVIRNDLAPGISAPRQRTGRSTLVLRPELVPGLAGVQPGDALVVLFAFDRSRSFSGGDHLLQHPEGDPARPLRGVFTLRSPYRPNPIGSTVVRVMSAKENELVVSGLDAFDGTPILDIKPYIAWVDEPQDEADF